MKRVQPFSWTLYVQYQGWNIFPAMIRKHCTRHTRIRKCCWTYFNKLMGNVECRILRKQKTSHENVWNVTRVQFRSECRWLYKAFAGGFVFIQLLLPGWYWLARQLIKQAALLSSVCIWGILKDRKVVLIRTWSFHLLYLLILFFFLGHSNPHPSPIWEFLSLCMIPKPQMLWKTNDPKERSSWILKTETLNIRKINKL